MFRFNFDEFLTKVGTIRRRSDTKDSGGGVVTSWVDVYTDVPVSLQPLGVARQEQLGKLRIQADHVGYTSQMLDLQNGDILVVDGQQFNLSGFREQGGTGEVFAIYAALIHD